MTTLLIVKAFSPREAARAFRRAEIKASHPLVRFHYPDSKQPWVTHLQNLRLISANSKYMIGLEVTVKPNGREKYQFKKFLRSKMGTVDFVEFKPDSMS